MVFGICGAMYTEDVPSELWSCKNFDIYVCKIHVNKLLDIEQVEILRRWNGSWWTYVPDCWTMIRCV